MYSPCTEHGKARLPGGHDVRVVVEDGQGMFGDGSGRHVENSGHQFSGQQVHVGDHQQQALQK